MPLWGPKDQANAAPKFLGVTAKDKAYAQQANITTTGTANFTFANNTVAVTSTSSLAYGQLVIVTPNAGFALSPKAYVTGIVNATAFTMSQVPSPIPLTLTTAPTSATSATLTTGFPGTTGTYNITFADGTTTKTGITLTNNQTAIPTWSGAVTQTGTALYAVPSAAPITFQFDGVRGQNLYNNTTPNAFQNNQALGVFNMLNIPNYATITATTISGNNILTNYAPTASSNGTLTNGSAVITALTPANPVTTGVIPGMLVSANTIGLTYPTYVTSVNSTAVVLSNTFSGTTGTGFALNFQGAANSTYVYGNTSAGFGANIAASSNTVQLVANVTGYVTAGVLTITGSNYGPTLQAGQTLLAAGSPAGYPVTIVGNTDATHWILANSSLTTASSGSPTTFTTQSLVGIAPSMQVYTGAASFTNGNTNLTVSNVIGTNVVLSIAANSTGANSNSAMVFTKIGIGLVAGGNNMPTLPTSSTTGTLTTNTTSITGYISSGTVGTPGNILTVTGFTGPAPVVGQELLANSTIGIANGVAITSIGTAAGNNGIGTYGVNVTVAANGTVAPYTNATISTVIPKVVYVSPSVIQLSANAYATGSAVGNTVTFSSFEQSTFGHSQHAGWTEVRYGSGPVVPANSSVNAAINSTSTSGYSNGETIIVSGGSANALLTITTNSQSGTAGANIAGVSIAYPGSGFTNTGVVSYTYQHQLHLANVTATGTPTGYVAGDQVTVTCTNLLANVTGYQTGNIFTVTNNQTGTLTVGNLLGIGFTATLTSTNNWLTALSTTTGLTPGMLVSSTTAGILPNTTITAVNSSVVVLSANVGGSGAVGAVVQAVNPSNRILSQLSGSAGGNGTYQMATYQTIANSASPYNQFISTGQIVVGVANITGTAVSNSTITITNQGLFTSGLSAASLVFTYANSIGGTGTGSGITFAGSFASASAGTPVNVTLGGRSGRQYVETIVALTGTSPYVTENAADNVVFPNS